ncbi:MAG: sigma-70 family RNA polymerase sigma factor [Elusimicrobiota bacterium]
MTEEELVRRYGAMVFNLALRLTGNRADAEDLAQESLLKAVRGWASFRGEADPGSWVYRITANAWKNQLRSKSKWGLGRFLSLDGWKDEKPFEVAGDDPLPEAGVEAAEKKRLIEEALEALTPEERAVLVLRDLDDVPYADIAKILDIPLGTVKSRLARARDVLAQKLAPEEDRSVP